MAISLISSHGGLNASVVNTDIDITIGVGEFFDIDINGDGIRACFPHFFKNVKKSAVTLDFIELMIKS